MRLFVTAFKIACKHSSRRLLCLFCILAVCGGFAAAFYTAIPEDLPPMARVAVVNLDDNPLSQMALGMASDMESLSDLLTLEFVEPDVDTTPYTAMVTIPAGFLESVMNGENLSPQVQVNATTPLEAIWVRQLAQAGARYLTAAQLGIYTVQEGMDYGKTSTPQMYQLLLADINLLFMKAFMGRLSMVEITNISATGGISLPLYYAVALISALFFCYGFLYQPGIETLRQFSYRLTGKGRGAVFLGALAHVWMLSMIAALPLLLFATKLYGFTAEKLTAYLLFALLAGTFAFWIAALLRKPGICGAGCILLITGAGFCSGCFLPLSLMPPVFSRIAPLTPTGQGQQLLGVLLGESASFLPTVLMITLLLGTAALLWRYGDDLPHIRTAFHRREHL